MDFMHRMIQVGKKRGGERAAVLQIPVSNDQKDIFYPAIADCAELAGTTKTHVILEALHSTLIEAHGYEGACIERVYRDASDHPEADPYPRKYGVIKGIESYFEGLAGSPDCPQLLYPMVHLFDCLADDMQLTLHAPIAVGDPRIVLSDHYAPRLFELVEERGGYVGMMARASASSEGTPLVRPLLRVVLDNWAICSEAADFLRRYLAYVSAACASWDDCASDRERFSEVCRSAYRTRTALEDVRASRGEGGMLARYPMAGGSYLVAPTEWPAVNLPDAPSSSHAYVVSVRRYGKPVPTFLLFGDKPASMLTDEEEIHLLAEVDKRWYGGSAVAIKGMQRELAAKSLGRSEHYTESMRIPDVVISEIPSEAATPGKPGGAFICR